MSDIARVQRAMPPSGGGNGEMSTTLGSVTGRCRTLRNITEPLKGVPQALFELDCGDVGEQRSKGGVVSLRVADVAWARIAVAHVGRRAGDVLDPAGQLQER